MCFINWLIFLGMIILLQIIILSLSHSDTALKWWIHITFIEIWSLISYFHFWLASWWKYTDFTISHELFHIWYTFSMLLSSHIWCKNTISCRKSLFFYLSIFFDSGRATYWLHTFTKPTSSWSFSYFTFRVNRELKLLSIYLINFWGMILYIKGSNSIDIIQIVRVIGSSFNVWKTSIIFTLNAVLYIDNFLFIWNLYIFFAKWIFNTILWKFIGLKNSHFYSKLFFTMF